MNLVLLDESNVVLSCNLVGGMNNQRMTANHVLSIVPVTPGQVFDDETTAFLPVPRKRWLTKLAFDNRFAMPEAVALKLAQNMPARGADETESAYTTRCTVAAQLQVLQQRLNMASYIDLDRADTRMAVQALESLGLLAEGRAEEILDGVIEEHEYHSGA